MELPQYLTAMLEEQYGQADAARIAAGLAVRRPVTLRANALKATCEDVRRELDATGIAWSAVPWYDDALVLHGARERDLVDLPLYTQGRVYLQSLSSMIPALVLAPRPGADVLDMCAAPGGKTTQIAALTGGAAHVTACELHMPRAERLEHNLRMQGATGVTVMRCDARRLDDFFRFDQILLDAPCSGSGTLRAGDARGLARFTPALVEKSTRSQRALLKKAAALLKPGERMVYSTCSILRQENEDAVEAAVRACGLAVEAVDVERFAGVPLLRSRIPGTMLVCPDGLHEGFFVAVLRKPF